TGELAAGLHAAEDAAVALFKVGVTAAAGAAGAWATKEARAAWMSVAAWNAARLARIADGEAAVASASLKAAAASAALAPLLAEKELIQQMAVYGPQAARIEREIAAAKAADTFATQELAAAESRLATERAASNLVTRTGTGATVAASAAMAALGGPLGLIVTGLTVGAAAWSLWGDSAENAADKAKKVSEDSAKDIADALEHIRQQQQRDATGNAYAPQIVREKEAISRLDADYKQARLGAERSITAAVREAEDERSKIIKKELDRRQENLKQLEDQSSTAGGSAKPRLSSASEYSKLTADLKWREKLVKDHQEALLNLQKAYADKSAATAEKDRPALLRNHQAALRAELERQKQELEALPDAKEGKAGADAMADARIRSMQAASKRVLEVLKHENEQYRLSSEEFIRTSAAVKANAIGEEIDALQAKIVAATRESERVPLRAKIADLKADLAGIAGEIAAGLEDADTRRRDLIAKLAVDSGRTLDPLARAGAEFGEKWGKAMQQAAANGWDDVLESGRAAWDSAAAKAMFDSAKARFEGVTKSAEASIENIRISAAIGTLPAVDALVGTEAVRRRAAADLEVIHAQLKAIAAGVEDPAIQTALAETTKRLQEAKLAALDAGTGWQAGARAAFVEYDRTVSDSAANTRRAFVDGYRRAEDAVVQFARTGKLNIRDFADYTINEYFRINAAQPFVRGLGSLAGMVGGMNFEGLMSSARVAATGVQPFDYSSYYAQAAYIDANAKGGVFNQAGKVHYFAQGAAFSNSVVSTPTYFGFGDGEVGQMAENGPEAVMPLKRGRGGRLGIEVMGGTGGSAAPIVFSPTFHIDARGAAVGVASLLENYVGRALQGFKADMMSELNSGGPLAVATGRRS
ncbi:MAG: phage tail tape measure C-terminal domain-containing protein, partial [Rhodocyclaceae bacterium]|nr:phage tail tape measure C-terminal domain-containing protein [Rhodocyclaceae bacterium]